MHDYNCDFAAQMSWSHLDVELISASMGMAPSVTFTSLMPLILSEAGRDLAWLHDADMQLQSKGCLRSRNSAVQMRTPSSSVIKQVSETAAAR